MPLQAQRGGGGIVPAYSQPSTRRRWVVSTILQTHYFWLKPGSHCTGGWMGLGATLDGTENLAATGFQSTDHPACSKMLYQLHYPGCPRLYCG